MTTRGTSNTKSKWSSQYRANVGCFEARAGKLMCFSSGGLSM
jgi:hypothetical protein